MSDPRQPFPLTRFINCPVRSVSWDKDEVPDGYVDVTVRLPETGLGWSGGIVADLDLRYDPGVRS